MDRAWHSALRRLPHLVSPHVAACQAPPSPQTAPDSPAGRPPSPLVQAKPVESRELGCELAFLGGCQHSAAQWLRASSQAVSSPGCTVVSMCPCRPKPTPGSLSFVVAHCMGVSFTAQDRQTVLLVLAPHTPGGTAQKRQGSWQCSKSPTNQRINAVA